MGNRKRASNVWVYRAFSRNQITEDIRTEFLDELMFPQAENREESFSNTYRNGLSGMMLGRLSIK
jgi:hypothetical protein